MPDDVPITATCGDVILTAQIDQPKRPGLWERMSAAAKFLRNFILSVAVIGALGVLAWLTIAELRRNPIIIEPIAMPPILSDRGFTGTVAAHRLWDAIADIQKKSGTSKAQALLTTDGRQLDIVEPGSGLSLQGLTRMMRAVLNLPQTRISGEVICDTATCDWRAMQLRLRIFSDGQLTVHEVGMMGGHVIGDYFHRAAIKSVEPIDPYALAAFHYVNGSRVRSIEIAESLIRRRHRHRAWAANLLGILQNDQKAYEASIKFYESSVSFAQGDGLSRFALPWYNWGNSLADLGRHKEAIEKYRRATEIDPDYADPWNGWGNRLGNLGRHEEAFDKYEKALSIDPGFVLAAQNWSLFILRYLDDEPAEQCSRVLAHAPAFLTVGAPLLEGDTRVGRIRGELESCRE